MSNKIKMWCYRTCILILNHLNIYIKYNSKLKMLSSQQFYFTEIQKIHYNEISNKTFFLFIVVWCNIYKTHSSYKMKNNIYQRSGWYYLLRIHIFLVLQDIKCGGSRTIRNFYAPFYYSFDVICKKILL